MSSATRLNQQHALYAQHREEEHLRNQSKVEVTRYYDHWTEVNSRFNRWTAPEYYVKAEGRLKDNVDRKLKETVLEERRAKLKELFNTENERYESEIAFRHQKGRRMQQNPAADLQTLENLNHRLKQREQIKRKLNMEAKLYSKWRHGVNDENLILDSKTDNEVLAKLNWVDKQIEEQMQREKQSAMAEERILLLQEEANKAEQFRNEREQMRGEEIKELRTLQEQSMAEIKKLQAETEHLKEEETHLSVFLSEIKKEEKLIEASSATLLQRQDFRLAFNLRKIKILIRQRSEAFCKQIKLCISVLERLRVYATKPESVASMLKNYKEQLELELVTHNQIESMYESEAKYNLERCENLWRQQHLTRCAELKALLADEQQSISTLLAENRRQQNDLIDLRSTYLTTIENVNDKLQNICNVDDGGATLELAKRDDEQGEPTPAIDVEQQMNSRSANEPNGSYCNFPGFNNSFSNLNLSRDNQFDIASRDSLENRLKNTRTMNVVTASNVEWPRFGRKRIAWT